MREFCLVRRIAHHWARIVTGEHEPISWTQDVREGRFQKQMAIATVVSAFFSGLKPGTRITKTISAIRRSGRR